MTAVILRPTIECCRHGHLVYVRNLKCASTFFWHNFTRDFGWNEIGWSEIDWSCDHVFSHVIEPWHRRAKGLAEAVRMHNLEHHLHSEEITKLIQDSVAVDEHTLSMHSRFGSRMWEIDWIPIDDLNFSTAINLTERLMRHHSIEPGTWNSHHEHASPESLRRLARQIFINDRRDFKAYVAYYLEQDLELWTRIQQNFQAQATDWPSTSWLRKP